VLLIALSALAGLSAIAGLFRLRFAQGDVFPVYSSRRADRLGARALHDALALLPGVTVERLDKSPATAGGGAGVTLFRLGGDPLESGFTDGADRDALLAFAARGGRVVIAPEARNEPPAGWLVAVAGGGGAGAVPCRPAGGSAPAASAPDAPEPPDCDALAERVEWREGLERVLGLRVVYRAFTMEEQLGLAGGACASGKGDARPAECFALRAGGVAGLPERLRFTTVAGFEPLAPEWRTLYTHRGMAAVITRPYGAGSIVMLAEGYPLSNEGLAADRATGLLAWLSGDARLIRFDEAHLGFHDEPGVMKLLIRYRLHGLLAGVLLAVLLAIWGMAGAPAPRLHPAGPDPTLVAGRGGSAGLLALLRRAIPARRLLSEMLARWRPSRAASGWRAARLDAQTLAEFDRLARYGDPVGGYNRIHDVIHGAGPGTGLPPKR